MKPLVVLCARAITIPPPPAIVGCSPIILILRMHHAIVSPRANLCEGAFHLVGPSGCMPVSDCDHDIAHFLRRLDIARGLDDLLQRVDPINDGTVFSVFDDFLE
jgi:hypothetical protein